MGNACLLKCKLDKAVKNPSNLDKIYEDAPVR